MESDPSGRLDSWKDIAAYLKKDIRTCQRWHRDHGLPVRRYIDSSKSRIFAEKHEIDAWLRTQGAHNGIQGRRKRRTGAKLVLGFLAAAVLLIVFFLHLNRPPVLYSLDSSHLVLKDGRGRRLLDYDWGNPKLGQIQDEAISDGGANDFNDPRSFARVVMAAGPSIFGWAALNSGPSKDSPLENCLVCVSRRGRLRWRYRTDLDFIIGFIARDIDGDGHVEILVLSIANDESTAEMAILDERGDLRAKFLHPGGLFDFLCRDVAGDAKEEIIVVGEYRPKNLPALAVLDLDKLGSGGEVSPETPPEQLIGAALYYVLFPDDPVERAHFSRQPLRRIMAENGRNGTELSARNLKKFTFELDAGLFGIYPTGRYRLEFPSGPPGTNDDPVAEQIKMLERTGLEYFDGRRFSSHPTRILD